MAEVTLKSFGWAPGGYFINCSECPDDLPLKDQPSGAKRAWRCQKHAQERLDAYNAAITSNFTPFNLNYAVKVKLNDIGHGILRERHDQLCAFSARFGDFTPPITDEYGYSSFQLWHLMNVFGPQMRLGGRMPFEAEILIPKNPS